MRAAAGHRPAFELRLAGNAVQIQKGTAFDADG
jgi:hypothetical protein